MTVCRSAVLAVMLVTGPSPAADPSPAAVDAIMADALKAWGVPGASLVVVKGGKVAVLKGYGVKTLGGRAPVGPDTVFPFASCTKAFTATLAAILADDGTLEWDDPVTKHLPAFHLSDPNADAMVTLRDLFSHRTGVRGHDLLWYHAPWNLDETLDRAGRLPLDYPYRGGYGYSSIMVLAAGRAAASAGGKPWEQLVRDRLTGPLGMTGVGFTPKDVPPTADRATGHRRTAKGKVEVMPLYDPDEPNPAGSMRGTARDLAAWLRFQLAGGVTADGKRLVSAANLRETHTPQTIIRLDGPARTMNPDTVSLTYGMGWIVNDHRGKRVLAHGGVADGFRIQVTLLPDDGLGFALLNNLHETRMNQAVTNTLIDLYSGLPPTRDWTALFQRIDRDEAAAKVMATGVRDALRRADVKPTLPPAGYAGQYEQAAYGTVTVTADAAGKLVLTWSTFRCPLEPWGGDIFRVTGGLFAGQLVPFAPGPDGKALALRFADQEFVRKE